MSTGLRAGTNNDGYLQVNGTDVLTALSSGNVGIGTDNPIYRLQLEGLLNDAPFLINTNNVNGPHIRFAENGSVKHYIGSGPGFGAGSDSEDLAYRSTDNHIFLSGATETLRITSTGNVGIGTNNSWDKLVVYGGGIHVGSAPNSGNSGRIEYNTSNGNLDISAYSTGGSTYTRIITSDAGNPTEKLRITASGSVGIGTDNPTYKLEVWDDAVAALMIRKGSTSRIILSNDSVTNTLYSQTAAGGDKHFAIKTGTNERLRITSTGNVGISTDDPAEKLHVVGKFRLFDGGYPYIDMGINTSNYFRLIHDNPNDRFYIGKNSNQALVIKANDYVGINTDPVTNLHIRRTAAQADNDGILKIENDNANTGSATNASLIVKSKYGWSQFMQWESAGLRIGSRGISDIGVGTVYLTAGADSVAMTLLANGNVGIKNTTPGYPLHVGGSINSEATYVNGSGQMKSTGFITLSANGTSDFDFGRSYVGHLYVSSVLTSNALARTDKIFFVSSRWGNGTAITELNSANGTSGSRSFTITHTSNGILRFTDTSNTACTITMTFVGQLHF